MRRNPAKLLEVQVDSEELLEAEDLLEYQNRGTLLIEYKKSY
jgi:hypothetical protein